MGPVSCDVHCLVPFLMPVFQQLISMGQAYIKLATKVSSEVSLSRQQRLTRPKRPEMLSSVISARKATAE